MPIIGKWAMLQHTIYVVTELSVCISHCPEQYIGETGRSIEERDREKEHKQACERIDTGRSAIAEHLSRSDHKVDWKSG